MVSEPLLEGGCCGDGQEKHDERFNVLEGR